MNIELMKLERILKQMLEGKPVSRRDIIWAINYVRGLDGKIQR